MASIVSLCVESSSYLVTTAKTDLTLTVVSVCYKTVLSFRLCESYKVKVHQNMVPSCIIVGNS